MQVLVTGADGRLGRILRRAWVDRMPGFQPVWSKRTGAMPAGMVWNIAQGPVPDIANGAVVLHLAGVLHGDQAELQANSAMALSVCKAAHDAGARHVFLASSSAVYGASAHDLAEVQPPAPRSDYGHAKLAMERDALCWRQSVGADAPGVTCLRIGNVLGADTLFGQGSNWGEVVLDPVAGGSGGPVRSYIGPQQFAAMLAALCRLAGAGADLPPVLNLAQARPVAMADLLSAAGRPFHFGPQTADVIPRVSLSTRRLARFLAVADQTPCELVADWQAQRARAA